MTELSNPAAPARHLIDLLASLQRLWARLREAHRLARRRRQTHREIAHLDDHLRKDIGLPPHDPWPLGVRGLDINAWHP